MNCYGSQIYVFEVLSSASQLLRIARLFDEFLGRPATCDDADPRTLALFVEHLIEIQETCFSLGMVDLAVNRLKPNWHRAPLMAPVRSCSRSKLRHMP
ncbi:MAG: hypothetical protein K8U03_06870 [Planctomycetia bacterium]|nr:hypothetical protein [Planctomycetia bacterium]